MRGGGATGRVDPIEAPYVAQFDGIRALAVLAVLVSHYTEWRDVGEFGVYCFFVLSGFLITGILLRARGAMERDGERAGFVIRRFYARRALRLVPVYYATLVGARLVSYRDLVGTMPWHLAYLSNVLFSINREWPTTTSHLWSLSVEEQFYLVWPLLVLCLPRRWLPPAVCVAIVAAPLWRMVGRAAGVDELTRYVLLPGALDSLGVGALLALTSAPDQQAPAQAPGSGWWAGIGARWLHWSLLPAVPFFVATLTYPWSPRLWAVVHSFRATSAAVLFAWLVWAAQRADAVHGLPRRVLAYPPLVYLGRISYGVYLFHLFVGPPVARIARHFGVVLPGRGAGRFLVLTTVTVLVASASWHYFERRINALKRRFPYSRQAARHVPGASPAATPAG